MTVNKLCKLEQATQLTQCGRCGLLLQTLHKMITEKKRKDFASDIRPERDRRTMGDTVYVRFYIRCLQLYLADLSSVSTCASALALTHVLALASSIDSVVF